MAKKKLKDTDYLFISTYLRSREKNLLTAARMERMIDAPSADEAGKVLQEIGYGEFSATSDRELGQALAREREALFQALSTACQLFTQASRKTAETLGYSWQDRWDEAVPRFMEETQRNIAALPLAEGWGEELSRQIQAHERRKEQES